MDVIAEFMRQEPSIVESRRVSIRVVTGRYRGRLLQTPKGMRTRPASSRVREAVVSLLDARGVLSAASVLDLFAGSAAYSIELLSRGAAQALCVDHAKAAIDAMQQNRASLKLHEMMHIAREPLLRDPDQVMLRLQALQQRYLSAPAFDIVIADPPYAHSAEFLPLLALLVESPLTTENSVYVIERALSAELNYPSSLACTRTYNYGTTCIDLLGSAV